MEETCVITTSVTWTRRTRRTRRRAAGGGGAAPYTPRTPCTDPGSQDPSFPPTPEQQLQDCHGEGRTDRYHRPRERGGAASAAPTSSSAFSVALISLSDMTQSCPPARNVKQFLDTKTGSPTVGSSHDCQTAITSRVPVTKRKCVIIEYV